MKSFGEQDQGEVQYTFADYLEKYSENIAFISEEGETYSYSQLSRFADEFACSLGPEKHLIVIKVRNQIEPIAAYLGALRKKYPVCLLPDYDDDRERKIIEAYRPGAIYSYKKNGWSLTRLPDYHKEFHEDLALLLSTSGSTGSSKMVRLSYSNLEANARQIAKYLNLSEEERAISTLPFQYSYGLSVVNSHLYCGGSLVLTEKSVIEEQFWSIFKKNNVTSFAGVPLTFELLDEAGFAEMDLPSLRYFTQSGGMFTEDESRKLGLLAQKKNVHFVKMYGQTEATTRITYLPTEKILEKPETIGGPIPECECQIIEENGDVVSTPGVMGELTVRGPNVMMGYAQTYKDLVMGQEVQLLKTGDLAYKDNDGYIVLKGRKRRFIKIAGLRIGLDEVEQLLSPALGKIVCTGSDELLIVAVKDTGDLQEIEHLIAQKIGIPNTSVFCVSYAEIPLLPSNKVDYEQIKNDAKSQRGIREASEHSSSLSFFQKRNALLTIFKKNLGVKEVKDSDSFLSLGGDSLSYVAFSQEIERYLGTLPENWESLTYKQLLKIKRRTKQTNSVEVDVLIRGIAILGVVLNHSEVFSIRPAGGALILFLLAGYSFQKFQGKVIASGKVLIPYLKYSKNLLIPYVVMAILSMIWFGQLDLPTLFLYGNWVGPHIRPLFPAWFIQLLFQTVSIYIILLLIPQLLAFHNQKKYIYVLILTLTGMVATKVLPQLIPFSGLWGRLPHLWLFVFTLGALVFLSRSIVQKIITFSLIILITLRMPFPSNEFLNVETHSIWMLLCGILLVWQAKVKLFVVLKKIIVNVSAATYVIFLTHGAFLFLFSKMYKDDSAVSYFILTVISGCLVFQGIEYLKSRYILQKKSSEKNL